MNTIINQCCLVLLATIIGTVALQAQNNATTFEQAIIIGASEEDSPVLNTVNGDSYMLFVNGGALVKEITVDTTWADFVFNANYKLPTLAQEETFIMENGHLTGFPSEKSLLDKGGVPLGAMTVAQQAKIEELMLHVIDLNKQLQQVQQYNQQLMQRIEALENDNK